jgi:hypothetical protein
MIIFDYLKKAYGKKWMKEIRDDAVGFKKNFIATGLSSRYFYPHLFHDALILASFSIEI